MELHGDSTHLLANLGGWVDYLALILADPLSAWLCLAGLMENWHNWLSSWARWWNIPNQSQPNRGLPGDGSPCTVVDLKSVHVRSRNLNIPFYCCNPATPARHYSLELSRDFSCLLQSTQVNNWHNTGLMGGISEVVSFLRIFCKIFKTKEAWFDY